MKLAVFGQTARSKHLLMQRARSAGFAVNVLKEDAPVDDRAVRRTLSRAHAVLCILKNPSHTLDAASRQMLEQIIEAMQGAYIQRIVVFSCVNEVAEPVEAEQPSFWQRFIASFRASEETEAEPDDPLTATDLLKQSGLEWTIVGHPPAADSFAEDIFATKPDAERFSLELAKCMVSQVTDARYVRGTYMFTA